MQKFNAQLPSDSHWFEQIKCQAACPVHTDARGYIQAIAHGDYEQAYLIARGPNPLASICGRVCGAPCETACRRGEIDSPIQIRALKRFVTEKFGSESGPTRVRQITEWLQQQFTGQPSSDGMNGTRPLLDLKVRGGFKPASGQRIAIIGSGPAGLAAAHDLALMGFAPVIFEMEPVAAGMLAVGVPEYRLPRDLIQAEVKLIESLGVEIRCNTTVGRDVTFSELRQEFEAVIIAVGAKKSRMLSIPGADAPQVLGGVEFLRDVSLGNPVELGERVVVIGGGNVAFDVGRSVVRNTQRDAATVAARLSGVRETHLCCLESRVEMPADEVEIFEGSEEGILLHPAFGPSEIHLEDGRVTGVTFVRCTRVFDEQQRFSPLFDESDRLTINCDTVLLAIGQQFDLSFLDAGQESVALLPNGAPRCDPETLETTADRVYLAGDLAHGTKLLIHAVASGKQAARSIYRKLVGEEISPQTVELHIPLLDFAREYDYEARQRTQLQATPVERRILSQSAQVELPMTDAQARHEASRCLNCSINTIFDGEKCILCGGCVDVCPSACLKITRLDEVVLNGASPGIPYDCGDLNEEISVILKDDDTCIRCGLCAARCPSSAVTMEMFRLEESIT